ncbi:hypothetical protein H5T87_11040 [bacterium]|nr:hypothetical protein [bacterium]
MNQQQKTAYGIGVGCAVLFLLVIGGCLYFTLRPTRPHTFPVAPSPSYQTTPQPSYQTIPQPSYQTIPQQQPTTSAEPYYVGNARTMKFHRPGCSVAQKISPANKVFLQTRNEAIQRGFIPCEICQP